MGGAIQGGIDNTRNRSRGEKADWPTRVFLRTGQYLGILGRVVTRENDVLGCLRIVSHTCKNSVLSHEIQSQLQNERIHAPSEWNWDSESFRDT